MGTFTGPKAISPIATKECTALMIETWFGVSPMR